MRKVSLDELAERSGMDISMVMKIEEGKNVPSLAPLIKIICEAAAVVKAPPVVNINTASGLPCASNVSVRFKEAAASIA